MHDNDRAFLLNELRQSREALLSAVEGLPEAQAAWKPASEWSIVECVEHVALSERGMLRMVSEASPAESLERAPQEKAIRDLAGNRLNKREAPAGARPTGRYPTLELAAQRFGEARDRTIDYVEHCPHDLRARVVNHPAFGVITAMECLLVMVGHATRHADQIREIRKGAAAAAG